MSEIERLRAEIAALKRERVMLLWIARQAAKAETYPDNQVSDMVLERLWLGLADYRADYGDPIARYDEFGGDR